MRNPLGAPHQSEWLNAFTVLVFGAIPFVLIAGRGGVLTGASGIFPADQLQYLAWVRDLSSHLLARNNFDLGASSRVFTNPFFGISGGLVRLGLSPGLAYVAWLPVSAVALLGTYRAYVGRLLPSRGERGAALALALFAVTPLAPVLAWIVGVSPAQRNQIALGVADGTPALQLWGYYPIAITLALVCASLLAVGRLLGPNGTDRPHGFRRSQIVIAAAAAAGSSWLHPWQGATLVMILGGLIALERSRRAVVACGGPLVAACLPLAYYYVLAHTDQAWSAAQAQNSMAVPAWVAPAIFLPLALPALLGVRRRVHGAQERILLLWPCAALAVYLLDPPYSLHALESASLPLAILAVRGWRRLRLRRTAAAALLLVATVPGLVFALGLVSRAIDERPEAYVLAGDDARALRIVSASPVRGGVLAPTPVAASVPGRTGRATWLGHPSWTPQLALRERQASRFFGGGMTTSDARQLVRSLGVRLALAPCGSSASLERVLGPQMLASSLPVGCARVLTFRR